MDSFKDIRNHIGNFIKKLLGDTTVIERNADGATAMLNYGGKKKISKADAVELGAALKYADGKAKDLSNMQERSIILDGVRDASVYEEKNDIDVGIEENVARRTSHKTRDDEERIR